MNAPPNPQRQNDPVKQHYIPEFYLKNFMREGVLWVRDIEKRETRGQRPETTATKRYYYSVEMSGELDHTVEKALATVESQAKPIIDTLSSGASITGDQKMTLSVFVALLTCRVPEFQKVAESIGLFTLSKYSEQSFGSIEAAQASIDEHEIATGEKLSATAKQMHEFFKAENYKFVPKRMMSLNAMLDQAPRMAENLSQMNWAIFHSPRKSSFVTTDNPLVVTAPPNFKSPSPRSSYGLLTPGALKFVPLTQSCCLVMENPGDFMDHRNISVDQTRFINLTLASEAHRFYFGRDKELIDSIAVKTQDQTSPRSSRIQWS